MHFPVNFITMSIFFNSGTGLPLDFPMKEKENISCLSHSNFGCLSLKTKINPNRYKLSPALTDHSLSPGPVAKAHLVSQSRPDDSA